MAEKSNKLKARLPRGLSDRGPAEIAATRRMLEQIRKVYERYGFDPERMIDYKALRGDTSDNIQGVKGIGPVGAEKLLQTYQTLDGIYQNLGNIKGANQKKLIESREQVYKAKRLVQFMDIPLVADLRTACAWGGPRRAECIALLRKYEFREIEQMLFGSDVVNVGGVEIGVRR